MNRDRTIKAFEKNVLSKNYEFLHYKKFDYSILKNIYHLFRPGRGRKESFNNVIIMADTETSKKTPDVPIVKNGKHTWETGENHIVAWTISIRAYHHNICTLYGRKPSSMAKCMLKIHESMSGQNTVFYFHNLAYDHFFMRKFWYQLYGRPMHQLNTKSHYPIFVEFGNGIIIKDSLILAQRKLEKWAEDLAVPHQKAVGKWDYDLIRNQNTPLSPAELEYIEHDTLAGVECLDATIEALKKNIMTIPYTATGIPRDETVKRGKKQAHDDLMKVAFSYDEYLISNAVYHGGFTHGDRHFVDMLITKETFGDYIKCFDFASSYPFTMLAFKFPKEKYTLLGNYSSDFILDKKEEYAFMFKFIAIGIRLKTDAQPMPALQYSKCTKVINPILDNGRIIACEYCEIYLNEWDLAVIEDQYTWQKHLCKDVYFAKKDYLPRWFTDYVYECFVEKCKLKGQDPVLYSIAKAKVNSLYGMCCQRNLRNEIIEDYQTGEYLEKEPSDPKAEYEKYINRSRHVLPYQWGVTVTSIAFYNLHQLVKCCKHPLYCDTDSCYGAGWDLEAVSSYNKSCTEKLIANNYKPVEVNGKTFGIGVAEHEGDKDTYSEFKYMGAKRYCGRCIKDNAIHITVAGVPKISGAECLEDDINNFHPGFIFSGTRTGKKTHLYFNKEEIYIDKDGNETGDSISLIPCDYELDSVYVVSNWEELIEEEVDIQYYDEY